MKRSHRPALVALLLGAVAALAAVAAATAGAQGPSLNAADRAGILDPEFWAGPAVLTGFVWPCRQGSSLPWPSWWGPLEALFDPPAGERVGVVEPEAEWAASPSRWN